MKRNRSNAGKPQGPTNVLFQAAAEIQRHMQKQGWRFCFIGGLAVLRWGEPMTTQDVDATLLTGFGEEERFIESLLKEFQPRIPDASQFALRLRVLLLATCNGLGVDVALAGLPFEEEMIERATAFTFERGCKITTCSAEDLVVLKAFADRPKDWMDVEGILARQHGKLDNKCILDRLTPLCEAKEAPEILERLKRII